MKNQNHSKNSVLGYNLGITYIIYLILATHPCVAPREIRHFAPCKIISEFKSDKSYMLFQILSEFYNSINLFFNSLNAINR